MRGRHVLLAAVAALLYAGCYAAIKAGLAYAPPYRFAALRSFIGGLALLGVLLVYRHPVIPARRLWLPIALLAVLGPLIGFSAMFHSPLHTGAGLASVVGNTGPLLVIVFAAIFLGERITLGKAVALVLGIAGVTLIASPSAGSTASWHVAALIVPLVAASSGAAETLIVKQVHPGRDVLAVTAWQFLIASIALFALSAALEPQSTITWTMQFTLLLALLAGGSTAAATALWYWLIQREEVGRLSLVLFLVPVAGLGLGAALFAERITPVQTGGIVLVFAGVAAAALLRNRTSRELRPSPVAAP